MPEQERHFTPRKLAVYAIILALFFVAPPYCTYVPFDAGRIASHASDSPSEGALFDASRDITRGQGGGSAFYPLVDGNDALGARLKLIDRAEHNLDLQYFLMKPDRAGAVISAALIKAADRGVKVRFLLDDIFTTVTDKQLAYLDSHENIELRLFNPLSRRSTKTMNFVLDFGRVNRRMHNKSMVADRAIAVFGGRNIAEEYFQINTSAEFADFDMLAAGPVVDSIESEFDLFWNDEFAVPIRAIHGSVAHSELRDVASNIDDISSKALQEVYRHAVGSKYLARILDGTSKPDPTSAELVTDTPAKLRVPVSKGAQQRILANDMTARTKNATSDVIIITPYFVPEPADVEMYASLAESGVRVRVITNSLASTNHAYVHGGYAPHRKKLLQSGVELYEVRADAPRVLGQVPEDSDVRLTMHTKAAVFDQNVIFVGSMNFDPRSVRINTEVGVFLNGSEAAGALIASLSEKLKDYVFALSLDDDGDIVWTYSGNSGTEVFHSEPEATFMEKLIAGITRYLPVKSQL